MQKYCCDKCLFRTCEDFLQQNMQNAKDEYTRNCSKLIYKLMHHNNIHNLRQKIILKTCGCEYHRECLMEILLSYTYPDFCDALRFDQEKMTYFISCHQCEKIILDNIPISPPPFSKTTLSDPENMSSVRAKISTMYSVFLRFCDFDDSAIYITEKQNKETTLFSCI